MSTLQNVLSHPADWRWWFLAALPTGILVFLVARWLLRKLRRQTVSVRTGASSGNHNRVWYLWVILLLSVLGGLLAPLGVAGYHKDREPITHTFPDKENCITMLLVDASGTTQAIDPGESRTRLEIIKQDLRDALQRGDLCGHVGVLAFGGEVQALTAYPTTDRDAVLDAIEQITTIPGGTATGRAIGDGLQSCRDVAGFTGIDMTCNLFLVSDGAPEGDSLPVEEALKLVNDDPIIDGEPFDLAKLNTVAYGSEKGEINGVLVESADSDAMEEWALAGDGQSFEAKRPGELARALADIEKTTTPGEVLDCATPGFECQPDPDRMLWPFRALFGVLWGLFNLVALLVLWKLD